MQEEIYGSKNWLPEFCGKSAVSEKICVCVKRYIHDCLGAATSSKLGGSRGERCAEGSDRAEGEIENIFKSAHPEFQVDVA